MKFMELSFIFQTNNYCIFIEYQLLIIPATEYDRDTNRNCIVQVQS